MKKVIATAAAPSAIGPYSQAIQVGNLLYTSGQIPIDPRTGNIEADGIEPQTESVTINAMSIHNAALNKDIVKATAGETADSTTYNGWYSAVYQTATT